MTVFLAPRRSTCLSRIAKVILAVCFPCSSRFRLCSALQEGMRAGPYKLPIARLILLRLQPFMPTDIPVWTTVESSDYRDHVALLSAGGWAPMWSICMNLICGGREKKKDKTGWTLMLCSLATPAGDICSTAISVNPARFFLMHSQQILQVNFVVGRNWK